MTLISTSNLPELKVQYKSTEIPRRKIQSSRDSFELLKFLFCPDTLEYCEEFIVIYLNQANNTIGWERHSYGGITSTVVDIRKIFSVALSCGAVQIILSHNHPSGATRPSEPDKTLTQRIKDAGKFLDIRVLDHIIFTPNEYYSFADEGTL